MKISIIGPGIMPIPPKGWGAVESLIWDYKINLEKIGHEVQIVNTPNVHEIIYQVNDFNPDFVHLQYDNFFDVLNYIKCPNKAATTHYGYLEAHYPNYGGYSHIMNGFINSNFNIICLSDGIKKVYENMGVNPNRLFVIPNGAREDQFRYTDQPTKPNRSAYLAKVTWRKRQTFFQNIDHIDFIGNHEDPGFNYSLPNYLGEWDKETLYDNLTDYANLVLLSDGEADPLVTKEAMMAGLGLVISQYSTANLDLSVPFIDVIPENRITDLNYVNSIIIENRRKSLENRSNIREYAINNFTWSVITKKYIDTIESIMNKS